MKFSNEVVIKGMKRSKGDMDGMAYDSTKFYIEADLDASKGNCVGTSTIEYSMGTSLEYDKFSHLPHPYIATAEMEIVTTGKVTKIQLLSLKPKANMPAAKAA